MVIKQCIADVVNETTIQITLILDSPLQKEVVVEVKPIADPTNTVIDKQVSDYTQNKV